MNSIKKHIPQQDTTTYSSDIKHHILIESMLEYKEKIYYQCASCRAENTLFIEKDFFQKQNYRFLPVFTDTDVIIFRNGAFVRSRPYKKIYHTSEEKNWWINIKEHEKIKKLKTGEQVVNAVNDGLTLVGKTIIGDTVLTYPIKTINIGVNDRFQVDTGILLYPYKDEICLGFIIFNNWDYAEFILEYPYRIQMLTKIMHFSKVVSHKNIVNELYMVKG